MPDKFVNFRACVVVVAVLFFVVVVVFYGRKGRGVLLFVCLFFALYLFIYLFIHLSIYLFICVFIYLFIFTFQVHTLELNVFFELLVLKLFTLTWAGCSQAN